MSRPPKRLLRWTGSVCWMAAVLCAAPLALAAPVVDALQRPALAVKAPQRTVLLSLAQAGSRLVAVGERGIVALSDDQGASWRQAPCPVSVTLTMVRFVNERQGVAVGHGGSVLTSADGGASWTLRLDGRRIATLLQAAAQTPQARQEAERWVADGPDKPVLDLVAWDERRLLVVGAYGLALYSSDGGASWSSWVDRLPNPKGLHWYVARRQGERLLLAGEQGLIARSDDGGQTFHSVPTPYAGSWFTGELLGDGQMLLAGLRGNVWRSPPAGQGGGGSWTPLRSPVPASITASAIAPDGSLLLASQAGVLLKLQGDSLLPLQRAPLPMPAGLLPGPEGRVLTVGLAGVVPLPQSMKPEIKSER